MLIEKAPLVWKHLNGIVCLYKPAGYSWFRCNKIIRHKLADDLNSMQCRKPKDYVTFSGDTSKQLDINVEMNYADHPLVVGPRYIPKDIWCEPLKCPGDRTSGVCIAGINKGIPKLKEMAQFNPLSTYHVVGQFGVCTHNKAIDGNILYTCNYDNLHKARIDKVVATVQSIHRKYLMKQCGYHPQSQEAYELIASGNVRPLGNKIPVIYSIKCIDFQLPYFTLEIVIVNEEEDYFLNLVDEIGMRAKNIAVGTSIRCLRQSFFTLEDALLQKHWELQYVLDNMNHCQQKLENNEQFTQHFKEIDDVIMKHNVEKTNDIDEEINEDEETEENEREAKEY